MKRSLIILLIAVASISFAQGNFTTEWESPAGWSYAGLCKLNANSLSMIFLDSTNTQNVRIYDGATHTITYSWTTSATVSYNGIRPLDFGPIFYTTKFDVNGDGINEIKAGISIVDPTNGNVLHSTANVINSFNAIVDIDNDGYVEIIEEVYSNGGVIKIISTPAQTVSVESNNEIVKSYELKQNYPNPFNPNTIIEYTLNKNSDVSIIIYDILGKEVNTLVNQKQLSGTYKLNLNASDLSSGTYFYSLIVDGIAESKKMILVK